MTVPVKWRGKSDTVKGSGLPIGGNGEGNGENCQEKMVIVFENCL